MNIDKKNKPIGVFDSGIGGLTVLKEILNGLPNESTIYLGDTARVPYGIRSPETVIRYSFENTRFLLKREIKLLIIACNTASAYSIEAIKAAFPVPCLGVIQPGARAAVQKTRSGIVAVIGTAGTINTHAYPGAIHKLKPDLTVSDRKVGPTVGCPFDDQTVEARHLQLGPEIPTAVGAHVHARLGRLGGELKLGCGGEPHPCKRTGHEDDLVL